MILFYLCILGSEDDTKLCRNMLAMNEEIKFYEDISPHSPRYGDLIHQAPLALRKLFRKLESFEKKSLRLNWSIAFNSICLQENILPTYVKIKQYDPALNKDKSTRKYQQSLIRREIDLNKQTQLTV